MVLAMAKVDGDPNETLSPEQWAEIAATYPDSADLVRAAKAWSRLMSDWQHERGDNRFLFRRAIQIWANEGGTDRMPKAHRSKTTLRGMKRTGGDRRPTPPHGPIITHLQMVSRVVLGCELNPETARKYARKFRLTRVQLGGSSSFSAEATVLSQPRTPSEPKSE